MLKKIGGGSYGEVWLARNVVGTLRAVKIVQRQTFERDEHFEREFTGIQKFEPISRSHEGLVDILHIGPNDEAGYFYYVMELADDADGEREKRGKRAEENRPLSPFPPFSPARYTPRTLRSEIHRRGRLPVTDCVRIGLALTAALQHLHKQGLVHRDIKPSNIIFVDGAPKLADIGLEAEVSEAKSLVGTLGYIPPEGPGSAQADLYSLGKVLYELVTGKDRQDFPALPPEFREQLGSARGPCAESGGSPDSASQLRSSRREEAQTALPQLSTFTPQPNHQSLLTSAATNPGVTRALPDANQLTEFNEILLKTCESDPRHAGERLGVRTVLAGSMKKSSNQLHIAARLIRVADGSNMWSASFDREARDIGAILSEVARRVTNALHLQFSKTALRRLETNLVRKLAAYEFCNRALKATDAATKEAHAQTVNLYQAAIAEDPRCARAYAGLANTYAQAAGWLYPAKEVMPNAKDYARRAMEIDETLADAHAQSGLIKLRYDYDWVGAKRELVRAVELDPEGLAIGFYVQYFWVMDQLDKSGPLLLDEWKRHPNDLRVAYDVGLQYEFERHYDQAIEQARWIFERDPDYLPGHILLKGVYAAQRNYEQALAEVQKTRTLDDAPDLKAFEGYVRARLSQTNEARTLLTEIDRDAAIRYGAPGTKTPLYWALGDKDAALRDLEQSVAERSTGMTFFKVDAFFDEMRAEPRFIALLKKMGLEK